jgi:hypothetical protein
MKTLREIEAKHLDEARQQAFREADRAVGISGFSDALDWKDPTLNVRKLREATSESAMPQLLRAGVQQWLFDAYAQVEVVFPDVVRVVTSNKYEELYAPLYGPEMPRQVDPGQPFEDSRLIGQDIRLKNVKVGRVIGIERELIDDDQTGQIQVRAAQQGERTRIYEEQTVMNAIVAGGAKGYTTTIGNVGNRGSGSDLTQPSLEAADIALQTIKDPLGNLYLVQPNTLLVGPENKFNAAKLLQSALQPSVPGASGQTASTAGSGGTGYVNTFNPLQGLYDLKVSRYLAKAFVTGLDNTTGAWLLLEARKAAVLQDRDPLEVAMEAPNSGQAFNTDTYRYRVRRRFNAGVLDSSFGFRGN